MNTALTFDSKTFVQLLKMHLTKVRKTFVGKLIDIGIWFAVTLLVSGYLMQAAGLAKDFGPFQLAGMFAMVGLFDMYGNAITHVVDFDETRIIDYYITLPTTALTVFASYICNYVLTSTAIAIVLLPLSKLLLWNQLVLSSICWWKLGLFVIIANSVWASMTFVFAALVPSIDRLGMIWSRIIFPMWFLGGFNFSWHMAHQVSPYFSYVMLINPVLYATEGMRAALLGQGSYLPFWLCCIALIGVSALLSVWGYKALQKRLDFV